MQEGFLQFQVNSTVPAMQVKLILNSSFKGNYDNLHFLDQIKLFDQSTVELQNAFSDAPN